MATLIEKLIAADKGRLKKQEKKVYSKKLSERLGEDTEILIQELSGRKMNDINQMMMKEDGKVDVSKTFDTNLMYCVEGIKEPSLKDEKLLQAFGAASPKDLAEYLFDVEANTIAGEIINLSGIDKKAEKKVKN